MTNIIDMARKHLCRKNIDADASNVKKGEKTTIEKPPKDLKETNDKPDADPEDVTKKTKDSPKPRRKKTKYGPLARLVDNRPRVPPGTRHHQRDDLPLRLRDGRQPRHILRRYQGVLLRQQRHRLPDVLRGELPHHALRAGVLRPQYTKKSARSSDRTLFFFDDSIWQLTLRRLS